MRRRGVLEQVIIKGAASRDFFGTAYGQRGDQFEGFKLGDANVQLDDTLLLIEPAAAAAYEDAQRKPDPTPKEAGFHPGELGLGGASGQVTGGGAAGPVERGAGTTGRKIPSVPPLVPKAKAFFGSVSVSTTTAKMKLVTIAEEVIAILAADPNASVKITVEISADFPAGASDATKRAVSENAASLGFEGKCWE